MRISVYATLDEDLAEEVHAVYREAFEPLKEVAANRQSMPADEFAKNASDPAVLKFVARAEDGTVAAIAMITDDIDAVPWVSPRYYEAQYPEQYADGRLFYFKSLFVVPAHQNGRTIKVFLTALIKWVTQRKGVALFDCCSLNVELDFPGMIARVARQCVDFEERTLDTQTYYGYASAGFLPGVDPEHGIEEG